jgi:hypothetical protein
VARVETALSRRTSESRSKAPETSAQHSALISGIFIIICRNDAYLSCHLSNGTTIFLSRKAYRNKKLAAQYKFELATVLLSYPVAHLTAGVEMPSGSSSAEKDEVPTSGLYRKRRRPRGFMPLPGGGRTPGEARKDSFLAFRKGAVPEPSVPVPAGPQKGPFP